MSQFDHESDDQSEQLNRYIRENRGMANAESNSAMIQQMAERQQFEERRKGYRGPDSKRHLQEEIYKGIVGAVAHFQNYLKTYPPPVAVDPFWRDNVYRLDPQEHMVRSLHAMILQELDLYLEAHEEQVERDCEKIWQEVRDRNDVGG